MTGEKQVVLTVLSSGKLEYEVLNARRNEKVWINVIVSFGLHDIKKILGLDDEIVERK